MTVLQNTVVEPDGAPVTGWLDISAVGSPFRPATQTEVLGPVSGHRFVGAWSVELAPGLYQVTQRRSDGSFHSKWTVQVPESSAPVWLASVLVEVPATPNSVPLLGIEEAAVTDDGHLVLTYTGGHVVDVGVVRGPAGLPWTGSPVEFAEAMADVAADSGSEFAETLAQDIASAVASRVTGTGVTGIRRLTAVQYAALNPKLDDVLYVVKG